MTDRTRAKQWAVVAADADAPDAGFSSVFRSHHDFVWRCVRRLGVPPALVDDATQEVFVIVLRRLADYDGRAPMRGWLFGILRRVAATYRRRARRAASVPTPPPTPSASPEELIARREAVGWVERFLDGLDQDQREVFVLVECEGVPVVDVARTLGIKANTAYSRLRLARRRFERAVARSEGRARALARRRGRA